MNGTRNLRYDPLYRVISVTDEMQYIEGKFKNEFDRIKSINNLGIIPEILEMAKYPKYEHHLGTIHQIKCLLDRTSENIIPVNYRLPLRLSALLLHLGHLPFTYSTERSLLLSSSLFGDKTNKVKEYIERRVNNVLTNSYFKETEKEEKLKNLFSLKDYKLLYKYFSCDLFVNKWKGLKDNFKESDDDTKEIIIKNLIDVESDGYEYLELADMADYVQRDALYFGTARLDISPDHLYRYGLSDSENEILSVDEKTLLLKNLDYLTDRFYDNNRINWFSRLYEKIVASLIIKNEFEMDWLEKLDDNQFKRLITENTIDGKTAKLPKKWFEKAHELFNGKIKFNLIFTLKDITFEEENNIIDVECKLLNIKKNKNLLEYPYKNGILLDINYCRKSIYPVRKNYNQFSVSIFQNNSDIKFVELLKVIRELSYYCSIDNIEKIRKGVCKQFSKTKSSRIDNTNVITSISDAIEYIEKEDGDFKEGEFLLHFLNAISTYKTYDKIWHNFENQVIWFSTIKHFVERHKDILDENNIRISFSRGLLSLPVGIFQYKKTNDCIGLIYNKLLKKLPDIESEDKKGYYFETLWLLKKMREKKGVFQFLINGMIITDNEKPKDKRDVKEYDVIELIINDNNH
ncbi:MAG: hypothetical protein M1269_07580, partial [Chloroflexi bacterium]|nr:hypothetical protein [Chloroflexota bacterium]